MSIGNATLTCTIISFLPFWALCASAAETLPDILIGTKPAEVIAAKITVSDLRKSYDFYTKVVGLKVIETPGLPKPQIDNPDEQFAEVCLNFSGSLAEPYMCLRKQKAMTLNREQAKLIWVSIKTPDARAALERVRASGSDLQGDVGQFRGVVMGLAYDPDGYTLHFIQAASVTR